MAAAEAARLAEAEGRRLWPDDLPRICACGARPATFPDQPRHVAVMLSADGEAHYRGLQSCGSVWACPVCAAKINAQRGERVERALDRAVGLGWRMAFVTLTMRHRQGQALADLWNALADALNAATASDRGVREARDRLGVKGFLRVVEVTHGEHGWHVHAHLICFYTGHRRGLRGLGQAMYSGWARRLVNRHGLDAPSEAHGIDIRPVTARRARAELGRYMAKNSCESAAAEASGGARKRGRGKTSRTPFQILADLDARDPNTLTGEALSAYRTDLALWHEWTAASKGRRQMEWGRNGLKEALGVSDARDDELAAGEDAQDATTVAVLLPPAVRQITAHRAGARLLRHLEDAHTAALAAARDFDPLAAVAEFCQAIGAPQPLPPSSLLTPDPATGPPT